MDETEGIRRIQTAVINNAVESDDETTERQRLEKEYGQVWNTQELSKDFEVLGFMAPYVVAKRISDGKKGALQFQHLPRFYFNFIAD
jgi:hypothetical protein